MRSRGLEVNLITTVYDTVPAAAVESFDRVQTVPAIGSRAAGIRAEDFLSLLIQIGPLRRLGKEVRGSRPIPVSVSPFLTDVLATLYLGKAWESRAVVMLHHVTKPPWWFPGRRGGLLRCVFWWVQQSVTLALVKIFNAAIMINETETGNLLRVSTGFQLIPDFGILPSAAESYTGGSSTPESFTWDACYVGRISASKGTRDLLSAWKFIHRRSPSLKLAIAASRPSGREETNLRFGIEKLALGDSVRLFTNLDDQEKLRLLGQSRVLVLPSYEEGWSLTAMEATWMGTPVVCYDLPAYRYLNGWCTTVSTGNRADLSRAILRILELSHQSSASELEASRNDARAFLRRYNSRRLVDLQLPLLNQL